MKIPKHHWENETQLWPFIWRILCFHPVLSLHPGPSLAFLWASCLAVPPYHRYIYYPFSVHAQQLSNFISKTSCLSCKRDDINRFAWKEYLECRWKGPPPGDRVMHSWSRGHRNLPTSPWTHKHDIISKHTFVFLFTYRVLDKKNGTSSISRGKRLEVKHTTKPSRGFGQF